MFGQSLTTGSITGSLYDQSHAVVPGATVKLKGLDTGSSATTQRHDPTIRAHVTSPRVGSSIYGAVQQLCLAARAYGIGTSLTTLYGGHEEELRELLGLPSDALTMALIPLGYPARGRWAQPRRLPVEDVVHWDHWGATRSRPE